MKRYGIEYTVLVPGEPRELNERVPQGANLRSFPTSFFLGRDGRVRSVHAGFPGAGGGSAHPVLQVTCDPADPLQYAAAG